MVHMERLHINIYAETGAKERKDRKAHSQEKK